jgi:hypothetical protein
MSNGEWLRKRWEGREIIVSHILKLLRKRDNSWPSLIKDIPFVGEVPNGRDLRGLSLAGLDLRSILFKYTDLRYADLRGSDLRGTDFETADLRESCLDDIQVDETTDWGTYFAWFISKRWESMSWAKFVWTQRIYRYLGYKGKIFSERIAKTKSDYKEVKKIYRALRVAYKEKDPTTADYFFYRENHCELVSLHPWWHPANWFGYLWEKISCSGTAPLRTLLILLAFIFVCAFLYCVPDGIVRQSGNSIQGIHNYGEAVYFSIITFTSLGYGDFHPNLDAKAGQILKYVCSFEAIIGIISIGIFTAIFLRFMSKE